MSTTQGVGANHTNFVRMDLAQALTEALEAGDGSSGDVTIESTLLVHAGAEPNALSQTIHDDQLAMGVASHNHVKTIGAEINCRE